MTLHSRFTVLIERRSLLRRGVSLLTAVALALSGPLALTTASAAPVKARKDKVAKDLQ